MAHFGRIVFLNSHTKNGIYLIGDGGAKALAIVSALVGMSFTLVIDFDLNFLPDEAFSEEFAGFE